MGTLLEFSGIKRDRADAVAARGDCEIVIFPGVRIERHAVDLGHRVRDTAGETFDSLGGDGRPRRSS